MYCITFRALRKFRNQPFLCFEEKQDFVKILIRRKLDFERILNTSSKKSPSPEQGKEVYHERILCH